MVEVQVNILSDQFTNIVIHFVQNERSLYEGPLQKQFTIIIPDLFSELQINLQLAQSLSSLTLYLLPLLTNSVFTYHLKQDTNSFLFSPVQSEHSDLVLEFQRKDEIRSYQLTPSGKGHLGVDIEKCLGIEKKLTGLGTFKYMENLLVGLNSKLVQQEVKRIVEADEGNYGELGSVGWETKTKLQENLNEILMEENKRLLEELLKEKSRNLDLEKLNEKLQSELNSAEMMGFRKKDSEKMVSELMERVRVLENDVKVQEESRVALQEEFNKLISEFQASLESFEANKASTDETLSNLSEELRSKNEKITFLENQNSSLLSETQRLNSELQALKTEANINEISPESENIETSSLLTPFEFPNTENIETEKKNISNQSEQLDSLLEKLKTTENKLQEAEENLKSQDDVIKLLTTQRSVYETYKLIENKPSFMTDFMSILHQLEDMKEIGSNFERKFYEMSMSYLKRINKLSELNLNMHRLFEKYFKLMYDKDCQIYMLRHIARDAYFQRQVYVPVKSDPIDVCLAEFINNRKVPLQIPLIREDNGVYNFYTRTIKLKVENNRVIVRLGGGFQGIDDFLIMNTQAELDKLEERRKFGTAEAVKQLIDSDFQILGLPSVIDHTTPPVLSNETSFSSNANNSMLIDNLSPQSKKRSTFFGKEPIKNLVKKKTMS